MKKDLIKYHEAGSFKPKPEILKRYTTLHYLQNILCNNKLLFSNPIFWEDKNDTELINEYKKRINASNIFLLCFSSEHETIHFWKTYSSGKTGCCIIFETDYLLSLFDKKKLKHGYVQYEEIKELPNTIITKEKIPFFKRYPYIIEQEYRVIYKDFANKDCFALNIDKEKCIKKVILSPDVPDNEYKKLKIQLHNIIKVKKIKIHKTTVLENREWIDYFKNL